MTKVKKHLRSFKRDILKGITEIFQVNLSNREKKYFYIKEIHKSDPFKEDWKNIGNDLRKSFDIHRNYLEKENLIDHQMSFDFNHIKRNAREKEESGERQSA